MYKTQNHRNLGVMITNKHGMDLDENSNYAIDESDLMSFESFPNLSCAVIDIYRKYNDRIIHYLEKNVKMRIEWVACDYVKDVNEQMWFVNLHAYGLYKSEEVSRSISYIGISKQQRIYGVLKCEMCKLDMPKTLI